VNLRANNIAFLPSISIVCRARQRLLYCNILPPYSNAEAAYEVFAGRYSVVLGFNDCPDAWFVSRINDIPVGIEIYASYPRENGYRLPGDLETSSFGERKASRRVIHGRADSPGAGS
jgi:hypothetical protein